MFPVERGPCEEAAEEYAAELAARPDVQAAAAKLRTLPAVVTFVRRQAFVEDDGRGAEGGIQCGDVVQRVAFGEGGLNCYERATLAMALLLAQGTPPERLRVITVELPEGLHTVLQQLGAVDALHPDGWGTIVLDATNNNEGTMAATARNYSVSPRNVAVAARIARNLDAAMIQQILPYLMQSNPQLAILLLLLLRGGGGGGGALNPGGSSTLPNTGAIPNTPGGSQHAGQGDVQRWQGLIKVAQDYADTAASERAEIDRHSGVVQGLVSFIGDLFDSSKWGKAGTIYPGSPTWIWFGPDGNMWGQGERGPGAFILGEVPPDQLPPGYYWAGPFTYPDQPYFGANWYHDHTQAFIVAINPQTNMPNNLAEISKVVGGAPPWKLLAYPGTSNGLRNMQAAQLRQLERLRNTDWYGIVKGILDVAHPIGTAILTAIYGPAGAAIAGVVGKVEEVAEGAVKSAQGSGGAAGGGGGAAAKVAAAWGGGGGGGGAAALPAGWG